MKAVFIALNQILSEDVFTILDELNIRGFTRWTDVHGRGSDSGEPRMGTHTWPALNDSILCVVEDDRADPLLERLRELDRAAPEQGLKAFVWGVEQEV